MVAAFSRFNLLCVKVIILSVQDNSEDFTVRIYLPNIVRIMQSRMIKIGSACSASGSKRNKFDLLGLK
jgi:hypothetical protein